jgi:hypothetical protein
MNPLLQPALSQLLQLHFHSRFAIETIANPMIKVINKEGNSSFVIKPPASKRPCFHLLTCTQHFARP